MQKFLLVAVALGLLALALGHTRPHEIHVKPKSPHPLKEGGGGSGGSGGGGSGDGGSKSGGSVGGGSGVGGSGGGSGIQSCPRPSPESLRCIKEWACQQVIRLDLRCLLNLNGNNLLGNLVSIPGVTGGGGGAGSGGILGSLLGGK